jgi:hypothetical protein
VLEKRPRCSQAKANGIQHEIDLAGTKEAAKEAVDL